MMSRRNALVLLLSASAASAFTLQQAPSGGLGALRAPAQPRGLCAASGPYCDADNEVPSYFDEPPPRDPDAEEGFGYYIPEGYFRTENIPGKTPQDAATLARKTKDLEALTKKWQRKRRQREYQEARFTGFSENAEILNGRFAMFFLVTGLATEQFTGQSIPEQIETGLRTLGVIGLG